MASIPTRPASPQSLGDLLILVDERADSRVAIAPRRGAIVTSFRVAGREILYLDEATLTDANKNVRGGIPILFPSPGKLDADRWSCAGRAGAMSQHGFARNLAWTVPAASPEPASAVTLSLESNEVTRALYPWDFRADFSFALQGACLRITALLQNTGASAMPFALGFHPYFLVTDKANAHIDTAATRAFDNLTKQVVPFEAFDLTARELDVHLLDHGSSQGTLQLADGARIQVRGSSEFSWWVVWTLVGKDFVCLEPWTAPGNALNSGERLIMLEPAGTREVWIEIELNE